MKVGVGLDKPTIQAECDRRHAIDPFDLLDIWPTKHDQKHPLIRV